MNCINNSGHNLIKWVYTLWMQHSEWTRMAFISIIFNNPDKEATINRLLRNPWDFACLFRYFYGDTIDQRFGYLMEEHLSLAAALVQASVDGNTEEADKVNKKLFENANHIAAFLNFINPFWHYEDWRAMFYTHLHLASQMATESIDGHYKESIHTYDRFEAEVMDMARMMVDGLIKQFPNLFF